jgi:hypothetical protein
MQDFILSSELFSNHENVVIKFQDCAKKKLAHDHQGRNNHRKTSLLPHNCANPILHFTKMNIGLFLASQLVSEKEESV